MTKSYQLPYSITPLMLRAIEQIGEWLGKLDVLAQLLSRPHLRRSNRIKTIQAPLEFMLHAILNGLESATTETDQVGDQVSDQVKKILKSLLLQPKKATELMDELGLSHRQAFRKNYLHPALQAGFIEMTIPHKPRSSSQRYRITPKGERSYKES